MQRNVPATRVGRMRWSGVASEGAAGTCRRATPPSPPVTDVEFENVAPSDSMGRRGFEHGKQPPGLLYAWMRGSLETAWRCRRHHWYQRCCWNVRLLVPITHGLVRHLNSPTPTTNTNSIYAIAPHTSKSRPPKRTGKRPKKSERMYQSNHGDTPKHTSELSFPN